MLSLEAKFLLQVFCGFFSTMYIVQLTYKQLEQFSVKRLPTSLPLSPLFTPQKNCKEKKTALKKLFYFDTSTKRKQNVAQ